MYSTTKSTHHAKGIGWCVLFLFSLGVSSPACTSSQTRHDEIIVDTISVDSLAPDTLPRQLSLLFVGDLMQHKSQIDAAQRKEGFDYSASFRYVCDEIKNADLTVGNLECTLGGAPYTGYPCFSAPDAFLYAICDAGFDVLTTANNHCLDRGSKGGLRTIQMLDSLNVAHLGTYPDSLVQQTAHPLFVEKNGFKLAFVTYTYGTNGIVAKPPFCVNYIDEAQMARDVACARAQQPDAIFALIHWGEEYQSLPSKAQRQLAEKMFAMGVTHIIGSHPHVVQPIEVRADTLSGNKQLLVYSLGNFISGMSANKTDGGLMVRVCLEKSSDCTTLKEADYSLVYTLRPAHNPERDFSLIPPSRVDSLQPSARNLALRFLNQARQLFEKHNKGIGEKVF